MKLISYNVGIKIDNSQKIGRFIKSQNPDIVALQEVIRHFDESVFKMYQSKNDIERILKNRYPYSFFGPLVILNKTFRDGRIIRDFGGFIEQGNEILSKFPIIKATNEFYHKAYEFNPNRTDFEINDHARAVQIAELNINNKMIQLINLHGTYTKEKTDSERTIKQSKFILALAKRNNLPTIIAGDFNLLPNTKSIALIDKEYQNLVKKFNIPATRPILVNDERDKGDDIIDYIFVDKRIKVKNCKIIKTDISDHYPLVLDFEIK